MCGYQKWGKALGPLTLTLEYSIFILIILHSPSLLKLSYFLGSIEWICWIMISGDVKEGLGL